MNESQFNINDQAMLKTLSEIGVYVYDFKTKKISSSGFWQWASGKMESRDFYRLIHPVDRKRVSGKFLDVCSGRAIEFHETFRLEQRDGTYIWIHSRGKILHDENTGVPRFFIGADTDITDMKQYEELLSCSIAEEKRKREEVDLLRQVAAAINSSLNIEETVRKILEETRRLIPYEAATVQVLEGSTLRIIGGTGFENYEKVLKLRFPYPEKGSLSTKAIDQKRPILSNDVTHDFPAFVQPDEQEGVFSWLGIPILRRNQVIGLIAADSFSRNAFTPHHRDLAEIIGVHIAIALENSLLHREVSQQAREDALTGIGNRFYLETEGPAILKKAALKRESISVVIFDIDFFKSVNDDYGHDRGDEVLQTLARLCEGKIRKTDLFVRYGGEEFLLIMPDTDARICTTTLERIRLSAEEYRYEGINRPITLSFGFCSAVPGVQCSLESYITSADQALYKSKKTGRNRITNFSSL